MQYNGFTFQNLLEFDLRFTSQVVGRILGDSVLLPRAVLGVALLPLVGLQGGLEVGVDALAGLLGVPGEPAAGLGEEGLEVRRDDMDFPAAVHGDAEGVDAVVLQLAEVPGSLLGKSREAPGEVPECT